MSVGIQITGRDVTFTMGGSAIAGVLTKGISLTNEMGETTDDDSSGWQEFAAAPLKKSGSFTVSGQLKNLEWMAAFFGASQIFELVATYPEGSVLTSDFALTSGPTYNHESNSGSTWEMSFDSSGEILFVAGT